MKKLDYTDYKLGLSAIKFIPIIMFFIMWIHTGLLIIDINGPCADTIAGSAIIPSILILAISSLFRFCWLHKLFTIYSLCIDLCINYERYIGFSFMLQPFRIVAFIIGIILFILLIVKFEKYKERCCVIKDSQDLY